MSYHQGEKCVLLKDPIKRQILLPQERNVWRGDRGPWPIGPPAFGWGRRRHCGHLSDPLSLKLLLPRCPAVRRPGVCRPRWTYDSPAAKLPVGSSFLPAPPRSQFLTSFSAVLQSSSFRSTSLNRQQAVGLSAKDNVRHSYRGLPFPTTFEKNQGTPGQQPKPETHCPPSGGLEKLVFPRGTVTALIHLPLGIASRFRAREAERIPLKDP